MRKRCRLQAVGKNPDPNGNERPLRAGGPVGWAENYWIRDRVRCENGRGCRRDTAKAPAFSGKVSALAILELNGGFGFRVAQERRRVVEKSCGAPRADLRICSWFTFTNSHSPARKWTRQSVVNATSTERSQKPQPPHHCVGPRLHASVFQEDNCRKNPWEIIRQAWDYNTLQLFAFR